MALKVSHAPKPVGGVTVGEIPAELRDAMASEWTFIQAHPDNDVVLTADSPAEAKQYFLYARAWANSHTPRLELRKVSSGTKGSKPKWPENEVHASLKVYDPNAKRPGRPSDK